MAIPAKKINCKNSKELIYSEHVNTCVAEHVISAMKAKNRVPITGPLKSTAHSKAQSLLKKLKSMGEDVPKLNNSLDISQLTNDDFFIEMNVALQEYDSEDWSSSEEESCEESGELKTAKITVLESNCDSHSDKSDLNDSVNIERNNEK